MDNQEPNENTFPYLKTGKFCPVSRAIYILFSQGGFFYNLIYPILQEENLKKLCKELADIQILLY